MSKLNATQILHIAKLAKLALSEAEVEKLTLELSDIVGYISKLSEVDIKNLEPTSQTTGLTNVSRVDEVNANNVLSKEGVLSGTDKTYNGYFVVDALLSERTDK